MEEKRELCNHTQILLCSQDVHKCNVQNQIALHICERAHTHTQTPYSWRKAGGYIRQRLKPLPTKMRFTNNKMAKHKLMLTHSHTCTIYNGRFESDGDKISCKMLSLAYKSISRHEPNVYIFPILPFCHRVPRVPYTGIDSFTVDEKLYALIFCT